MNFKKYIKDKKIVGMAPMDGFTDEPMRLLQAKISKPDVMFTEFVSAEGLAHGAVKLLDPLKYSDIERPIIAQLFGKEAQSFYKASIILCFLGFDGIDINMGCPAKRVTQHGSGAALIAKPKLAIKIIKKVKQAVDDWDKKKIDIKKMGFSKKFLEKILAIKVSSTNLKPTISVKTRLGIEKSAIDDWISLLSSQSIDILTLHGRTLKQGYAGKADWSQIEKARKIAKNINPKLVFWGNGDIKNRLQAETYIKKYKVDGILLGRATVGNPWVFDKDKEVLKNEKFRTMLLHAQIFTEVFPKRSLEHLRSKFLAYTKGFWNAKQIRKKLVRVDKISDLLKIEEDFL